VVDSISPWVKRFEDEADYKLFGQNRQGLYTKMNMRALMRGDRGAHRLLQGMVEIGAYSPNRILELEDENTIGADGDVHTVASWDRKVRLARRANAARLGRKA
jgi:phage portal protein BeeE